MNRALPTHCTEQLLVDCVSSGMEAVLPKYTYSHALYGITGSVKSSLGIQLDGDHINDMSASCVWEVRIH